MKEDNKNDPLEAQKRLFGTIKNIGKKIKSNNHADSSSKGEDPAYKYIKNSSANWKSKLNEEEKEYLNTHPGPFYENQDQFKKRFLFHKKFKDKQKDQLKQISNNPDLTKNVAKKRLELSLKHPSKSNVIEFKCPNCGSPIEKQDLFCGECGHKLEGINFDQPISKENTQKPEGVKKGYLGTSTNQINDTSNEAKKIIEETTQKESFNELPIETLELLKSFFDDQLIVESEYKNLRKSLLNLSNGSDLITSNVEEKISFIKSISREKLLELKSLFDKELIDKEEYDLLRSKILLN
tara:strand:+ start:912 stop:1796 length:885 start_codon:yes stop_codon:yes gene_type:complete